MIRSPYEVRPRTATATAFNFVNYRCLICEYILVKYVGNLLFTESCINRVTSTLNYRFDVINLLYELGKIGGSFQKKKSKMGIQI